MRPMRSAIPFAMPGDTSMSRVWLGSRQRRSHIAEVDFEAACSTGNNSTDPAANIHATSALFPSTSISSIFIVSAPQSTHAGLDDDIDQDRLQ